MNFISWLKHIILFLIYVDYDLNKIIFFLGFLIEVILFYFKESVERFNGRYLLCMFIVYWITCLFHFKEKIIRIKLSFNIL